MIQYKNYTVGKCAHGPKRYMDVLITITLLVAFRSFQNKIRRLVYQISLLIREVIKRLALVNYCKLTKNYYHYDMKNILFCQWSWTISNCSLVFLFVYSFQIDTLIWMVMRQATRYSTLFLRNILLYVVIQQIASFVFCSPPLFTLMINVLCLTRIAYFSHSAK